MLDGVEERGGGRHALECQRLEDRADPVLQSERTVLENIVKAVVVLSGVEPASQRGHGAGRGVAVFREHLTGLPNLIGVVERRIVDDLPDPPEHRDDGCIDFLQKIGELRVALMTPRITGVLVFA